VALIRKVRRQPSGIEAPVEIVPDKEEREDKQAERIEATPN
jgi:hypothetical protein